MDTTEDIKATNKKSKSNGSSTSNTSTTNTNTKIVSTTLQFDTSLAAFSIQFESSGLLKTIAASSSNLLSKLPFKFYDKFFQIYGLSQSKTCIVLYHIVNDTIKFYVNNKSPDSVSEIKNRASATKESENYDESKLVTIDNQLFLRWLKLCPLHQSLRIWKTKSTVEEKFVLSPEDLNGTCDTSFKLPITCDDEFSMHGRLVPDQKFVYSIQVSPDISQIHELIEGIRDKVSKKESESNFNTITIEVKEIILQSKNKQSSQASSQATSQKKYRGTFLMFYGTSTDQTEFNRDFISIADFEASSGSNGFPSVIIETQQQASTQQNPMIQQVRQLKHKATTKYQASYSVEILKDVFSGHLGKRSVILNFSEDKILGVKCPLDDRKMSYAYFFVTSRSGDAEEEDGHE